MKLKTRELVLLGVFGALWGGFEMSFGALMHAFHLPFRGAVLPIVGIGIALIGYGFVRKSGFIFSMAVIACLMKLFSIGGFALSPIVSVLLEALVAEAVLRVTGATRTGYAVTGGATVLYSIMHPFIAKGLVYGEGIYTIYLKAIAAIHAVIPAASAVLFILFLLIGAAEVAAGALAGFLAWSLHRELSARLSHLYILSGDLAEKQQGGDDR